MYKIRLIGSVVNYTNYNETWESYSDNEDFRDLDFWDYSKHCYDREFFKKPVHFLTYYNLTVSYLLNGKEKKVNFDKVITDQTIHINDKVVLIYNKKTNQINFKCKT